eukprot:6875111-Alexandrium_andersonii.AAC.1
MRKKLRHDAASGWAQRCPTFGATHQRSAELHAAHVLHHCLCATGEDRGVGLERGRRILSARQP